MKEVNVTQRKITCFIVIVVLLTGLLQELTNMVKILQVIYEEYLHYIGLSKQNAALHLRHSFRRAEIQEQHIYIISLIIIASVK